jgi:Tol biopolymer transport system component
VAAANNFLSGEIMKTKLFFARVLCFCLILSGCSSIARWVKIDFPNRDIVFEANYDENYGIGFINADGSSPEIFSTKDLRIVQPIWSQDKKKIYFHILRGDPGMEINGMGGIGVLETGQEDGPVCDVEDTWTVYQAQKEGEVIYTDALKLVLMNLDGCKTEKILVDYSNRNQTVIYLFSLSRDKRYVLYTENYVLYTGNDYSNPNIKWTINRLDLQTGETQAIGDGVNATMSPDDRQIAFVRPDGIYLMNFDGSNIIKLVDYRTEDYPMYEPLAPLPNWSPDGQWLVYHKCVTDNECEHGRQFNIFKLNVSTDQETQLYTGGLYPYWP